MPCYCPLTAYYSREIGKSGKRGITFERGASFSGQPLRLPCGQCVGCRLERSRQWAMRCIHEKQLHDTNCFLTLTYDNDHLPYGGTLVKRDMQLFMKRLRKEKGDGIRFYGCGEYGENTYRPHYHIILFNCDFSDKKFYSNAACGEKMFTSASVDRLWPVGAHMLGNVTFDSAAYVARYIMKKITGPGNEGAYDVVTEDGEIVSRVPEFTLMSRRPGIGSQWFDKFGRHAYAWDSVVINGKEVRPPRFYDGRYELVDSVHMQVLKVKRRSKALLGYKDNLVDRRRVREAVAVARLAQKGRKL